MNVLKELRETRDQDFSEPSFTREYSGVWKLIDQLTKENQGDKFTPKGHDSKEMTHKKAVELILSSAEKLKVKAVAKAAKKKLDSLSESVIEEESNIDKSPANINLTMAKLEKLKAKKKKLDSLSESVSEEEMEMDIDESWASNPSIVWKLIKELKGSTRDKKVSPDGTEMTLEAAVAEIAKRAKVPVVKSKAQEAIDALPAAKKEELDESEYIEIIQEIKNNFMEDGSIEEAVTPSQKLSKSIVSLKNSQMGIKATEKNIQKLSTGSKNITDLNNEIIDLKKRLAKEVKKMNLPVKTLTGKFNNGSSELKDLKIIADLLSKYK